MPTQVQESREEALWFAIANITSVVLESWPFCTRKSRTCAQRPPNYMGFESGRIIPQTRQARALYSSRRTFVSLQPTFSTSGLSQGRNKYQHLQISSITMNRSGKQYHLLFVSFPAIREPPIAVSHYTEPTWNLEHVQSSWRRWPAAQISWPGKDIEKQEANKVHILRGVYGRDGSSEQCQAQTRTLRPIEA